MNLFDKNLVQQTVELVKNEKKFTVLILKNLQQIADNKIYLDYNCNSLFSFCTKILGYGDGEAAIRVNAMKLLVCNQGVEKKIIEGKLTLTTAAAIQNFIQKENKEHGLCFSDEEKEEIISSLAGKSSRDAKVTLGEMSKVPKPKQYQITIDEDAYKKLMEISKELGEVPPL